MTAVAGRLVWDLDVDKQAEAMAKVEAFGRKLDEALNKGRKTNTGIDQIGLDAILAGNRVNEFAREFVQLNVQLKTGQITATAYGASTKRLLGDLNGLARATDLTEKEFRSLNTLIPQVARGNATLGGTTAEVQAHTQRLIQEVFRLRTTWQTTGQATEETKARLHALVEEMLAYAEALRQTDGGMVKFGANIRQVSAGARTGMATIDGMEGRMSRLGLASQVNLAAQQALTNQFYRFGPAGQVAGSALGLVGAGMGALSVGTLGLGAVLAVAVAGVANLHKTGTPQVREFQQALAILRASGEELTESGLAGSLERIRNAAGKAGDLFTRAEMATAMAELVKAGIDASEAMDLLAPGMQLAAVTGQSLNDTTSALLANLRQFGLPTSQAARAADALAAADLAAAHGAAELSQGLATVGPVARAAGLTLEDTLGILVELDNKGLDPADKGATALRGTMSALLDPTKEARGVLKDLGVELENTDGSSRPLLTVLQELQEALGGNSEAAKNAAQIFDTRAITAILNMTDKSEELADSLRNSQGALEAYANEMINENLALAEQGRLKAWQDLAHTMATQAAPAMTAFNNQLARYFRLLDAASQRPWWQQGGTVGALNIVRDFVFGTPEDDFGVDEPLQSGHLSFNGKTVFDVLNDDGEDLLPTMSALITEATRLKAALESASSGDEWVTARRNIEAFQKSSDDAADAWAYVNRSVATTVRTTSAIVPTVESTFADLAQKGVDAERRALAFGNTIDAMIESAQTRGRLIGQTLNTLLVDFGLDPLSAEVQFLVRRLGEIEAELTTLRDRLKPAAAPVGPTAFQQTRMTLAEAQGPGAGMDTGMTPDQVRDALLASPAFKQAQEEAADAWRDYGRAIRKAATIADRSDGQEILGPTAGMTGGLTSEEIKELLRKALERRLEAYLDAVTSPFRQTVMSLAEVAGPSGGMDTGMTPEAIREALIGSQAHKNQVRAAELAWRDYVNSVQGWARFADERLGAELGGPSGGMSTGMTPSEIRAALEAAVDRRWREFQAEMTRPTRQTAMELTEVGGPSAGMATGMSPTDIRAALQDALPTVEKLQRRLIELQARGFDTNSEAVKRLVRQIGELELKAALKELREKGLKGLSEFNRQVLIANGILPGATTKARSFSDVLRTLAGNEVADGLADIIDGIRQIREAGGDAEKVVSGLTLALTGATKIVESLSSGDTFGTVKNLAMLAGEGIGQLTGIPGLGQAVGGALDLGRAIVQSISDAFTGDSPAARAIRESLTPAVTSAFSAGIMAALRGETDWRDGLQDDVKTAFVGALIQAFIQSAIVGAILQPIITQFSKLIARGQYDEATRFLQSELPAALDAALRGVDAFVAGFPAGWLAPTGGTGGGQGSLPSQQSPASFHSLPIAQVAAGPPAWVNDVFEQFGGSVGRFGAYVDRLVDEGITIKTRQGSGGGSNGLAASGA